METTSRNLVEALIGVLAIWLVVHNLPDYVTGLFTATRPSDELLQPESIQTILSIHIVGSISIGFLLLLLRRRIASWLAPDIEQVVSSASALLFVGTILIAILFLGSGLSQLIGHVISRFEYQQADFSFSWSGVGSILVGIVLLVGSRWIPKLCSRLPGDKGDAA